MTVRRPGSGTESADPVVVRPADPDRTGWVIDWASPWTWTRLALASMGLSACISVAIVAAVFVDARFVVELIGRLPSLNLQDDDLTADILRMAMQFMTVAALLAASVEACSAFFRHRVVLSSADAASRSERDLVSALSDALFVFVSLWSFLAIYIVDEYHDEIKILDISDRWFYLCLSFVFCWFLYIRTRYLTLLRKILVTRTAIETGPERRAFIGPVGLAGLFAVAVIVVTLGLLGYLLVGE